jgi:hypothetical protein
MQEVREFATNQNAEVEMFVAAEEVEAGMAKRQRNTAKAATSMYQPSENHYT